MHEEALLKDLRRKVDELSAGQGGARVVRARVALGALAHLDEPRLRELWTRAMTGGPAEAAALDVELVPGIEHPRARDVVLRSVTFADTSEGGAPQGPGTGPSPSSPARR